MTPVRHVKIATQGVARRARIAMPHPYTTHVLQTRSPGPSAPSFKPAQKLSGTQGLCGRSHECQARSGGFFAHRNDLPLAGSLFSPRPDMPGLCRAQWKVDEGALWNNE